MQEEDKRDTVCIISFRDIQSLREMGIPEPI